MLRLTILLITLLAAAPALANGSSNTQSRHEDDATWSLGGGIDLTPTTAGQTMGARNFRFGVDRRIDGDRWLTFDGHLLYASSAAPIAGMGAAGFVGFAGGASIGMRYLVSLSYVDVSLFAGAGLSYSNQKLSIALDGVDTSVTLDSSDFGVGTEDEPEEMTASGDYDVSMGGQKYIGVDIVGGIDLERMITDGIGLRLSTSIIGMSYYTQLDAEPANDYKAMGIKLDSSLELRFYF